MDLAENGRRGAGMYLTPQRSFNMTLSSVESRKVVPPIVSKSRAAFVD
jgi:hypothetical protein